MIDAAGEGVDPILQLAISQIVDLASTFNAILASHPGQRAQQKDLNMTNTVKTDVAAITPTANAKAVAQSKGVDLPAPMGLLQQQAIEMQTLVRKSSRFTPSVAAMRRT